MNETKKPSAGIMEKSREAEQLISQLTQLIDSLQELQRFHQGETQLREISETTAKLERMNIPIPNELGRLTASLVSRAEELGELLDFMNEELAKLHARVRRLRTGGSRTGIGKNRKRPTSNDEEFSRDDRHTARRHRFREFWKQLLALPEAQTPFHANRAPSERGWITIPSGFGGLIYAYCIFQHHGRVELYIDRGDANVNKEVLDELQSNKATIEQEFGAPLFWDPLDTKRACRVSYNVAGGGYSDDEADWPAIQTAMIKAMTTFTKAIAPIVAGLGLKKDKRELVQ
jgi:hypothetical protein